MRLRAGWSDRLADLSDYNLVGRVEDGGPPFAVGRRGRDAAIIQFHGGCNFFLPRQLDLSYNYDVLLVSG